MTDKQPFTIPSSPLWEYIGDLSQNVIECSYNESDVREWWVKGTLDENVTDMLKKYPWRLEHWLRPDNLFSDQLTALVIRYGGWSPHWGWVVVNEEDEKPIVDPLTPAEQAIVDAFLAKYEIVISK